MNLLVSASKPEPKPLSRATLNHLHHLEYAFTLNGSKASCFRGFKSDPSSRISNRDNSPMKQLQISGFHSESSFLSIGWLNFGDLPAFAMSALLLLGWQIADGNLRIHYWPLLMCEFESHRWQLVTLHRRVYKQMLHCHRIYKILFHCLTMFHYCRMLYCRMMFRCRKNLYRNPQI
ncbi:hypothetical protein COLO4_20036 [Corchorus olitorius]|uniref:Uncharacterized protein n=1 Tax=Corchorus olitorius TaxID=93759 RepID=A0A1R3J220_9ROSI|nr:hypothetical protein COLO4_20036 [Corchorus olitorius]